MTISDAESTTSSRTSEIGRIPLSTPDVGTLEEEYLIDAFRSGWIAPTGPDLTAFESELAAMVGVGHAVGLASGTAALHLGLIGLGVRPGDRVITATMTFAATANAITYCGAEPEFVDCAADGNMDPALLHESLRSASKRGRLPGAVVPVDLLGRPADYDRILPIAAEFGVPVLVDAAESLGSLHSGRSTASLGRAAAVSFNGNKIMTTSGGGALLTDDAELAAYASYLSAQARMPVAHYEHTEIGYNYRLSNLLAAIGRAQLTRLKSMIEGRRAHRAAYRELLAGRDGIELFGAGNPHQDNAWLTAVLIDEAATGFTARQLGAWMADHDIETRPLWKPMHLQPVFSGCQVTGGTVSESLFATGLTLPSGSALRPDQLDRVLTVIDAFLCGGPHR